MKICFWDIESSSLRADFGSMLVSAIKPIDKSVIVMIADKPGNDKELSIRVRDELEKYNLIVTFYGKLFDMKFLRSRLAYYGERDINYQFHLDAYWIVRNTLLPSRGNMAHLAEFLKLDEKKFSVSPQIWNEAISGDKKALGVLKERCSSDTRVLEKLYYKIIPFVRTIGR